MPRHSHPPGYGKGKRGRHKRQHSKETREWERQHLTPPRQEAPPAPSALSEPPRPPWMDQETYERLCALRRGEE